MDTLTTPRLDLLPLDPDGARRLLAGAGGAAGRLRAPGYPDAGDRAGAERYLRVWAESGDPAPFGAYEILRREDGTLIGGAGFHGPADGAGRVTVGYGLVPAARGRGWASEALRALVEHARRHGAAGVLGDTDPGNTASRRVMVAAGLLPVGEDDRLARYALTWARAAASS
ncbi:GNAT family N-acetyltransferase [Streptomyces sp. NPDC001568]|uniref:GNAT family N-acetyltransferase n=1 Tax=Streptomyces sp. NPDC001568 TaxID=3364588 RepID=UPI0036920307